MDHIPDEVRDELESFPNVVGTGRGRKRVGAQDTDREAIVVLVREKLPDDRLGDDERVPETVTVDGEEVPTDVQEVGDVRAQSVGRPIPAAPPDRKRVYRPMPAGVSGAHPESTAGTVGTPPLRTADGETVFLTNAHVAAPVGEADEGDEFLQPGPADGGTADDDVGDLAEWSEIARDEPNTTDSALVAVDPARMRDEILRVGPVEGWAEPDTGATYTKSGRTTGVTTGELRTRDTRIRVGGYYDERTTFVEVDVFEPMSAGGDSGSLIGRRLDGGFHGTHLLFAGSDRATIGVPIAAVQEEHGELTPMSDGTGGDGGAGSGGGSNDGEPSGGGGGGGGDGGRSFEGRVANHLRSAYGEDSVSTLSNADPLDFRVDAWPVPTVVTAVADATDATAAIGPALAAADDDERPVVLYPGDEADEAAARAGRRAGVPVLAVRP